MANLLTRKNGLIRCGTFAKGSVNDPCGKGGSNAKNRPFKVLFCEISAESGVKVQKWGI